MSVISGSFATEQRLAWLTDRLAKDGQVRIDQAAKKLSVSEMTIRRDLLELEAVGVARRVRGGAVAVGPVSFEERHKRGARAKAQIAKKLLPLVPTSGAIGLDASSTIMRLAASIEGARDLTIVTNGLESFDALQDKAGITPVLTGGQLEPRTGSLVGPVALRGARQHFLKKVLLSAAGVDPELGSSETGLDEAEVKRAMASVADEVILACDSSKLGSRSVALAFEWNDVTLLVTELDPDNRRLEPYRRHMKIL